MVSYTSRIVVLLIAPDFSEAVSLQKRITACSGHAAQFIMTRSVMDAQKKLRNLDVDIVLLDLDAIETNIGHSLQLLLKHKHNDTPIIALSDIRKKDLAMEAIFKGANDYVIKGRDNHLLSKIHVLPLYPCA